MNKKIEKLYQLSHEITHLNHIDALLNWDQETYMPVAAAADRAAQIGLLAGIIHQKECAPELGELLTDLSANATLPEQHRALVRVMRRSYDHHLRLPQSFVMQWASLTSQGVQAWKEAKKASNFALFKPLLSQIVTLARQQADFLGYQHSPYDALLNQYEEGLTTKDVNTLFDALKNPLQQLIQNAPKEKEELPCFDRPVDTTQQITFSKKILTLIGYDFSRGREDATEHPFSTTLGHHDRRVTNHFNPYSLDFIFSALHEGGHALYEQGIDLLLKNTHLDTGVSLGIHESQSRLWENMVGRSPHFWHYFYPILQQSFPDWLNNCSEQQFLQKINRIQPGLIRVYADEVTYNMHILIRFELEKALIENTLTVDDLPAAWNEKYRDYLGVLVPNDAQGVLQDIHWSVGLIGYFPTYTLGNLYAAQIWHALQQACPTVYAHIAQGDFKPLHAWLLQHVYAHGAIYPPKTLIQRITGEKSCADYLIAHLQHIGKKTVPI